MHQGLLRPLWVVLMGMAVLLLQAQLLVPAGRGP